MNKERIRKFIRATFYVTDPVVDDASLIEAGIIDSTGMMEVIQFVEKEFGIAVRDDELMPRNFGSISSIAAFVDRNASRAPDPSTRADDEASNRKPAPAPGGNLERP